MIGSGLDALGSAGALIAAMIGASLLVLALAWALRRSRRMAEAEELSDGSVLLVSEGVVQRISPEAHRLLGACAGRRLNEVLTQIFGASAPQAAESVARLEMTGERFDIVLDTAEGTPVQLIGEPSGALLRLVLREARYLDERLREAAARVRGADAALRETGWERETLHALVEHGPIIVWHRSADGTINWSAGHIRTRSGSVTPDQTVDLVVARTRMTRQPVLAGEPQKARIEIVLGGGAETVSLHVVEIVRPDGSRVGFATDAAPAAAAERTLSRFVQTMTETFAHLTVGLAIFDRNQTLALFNPALVQMWQLDPAWLARRPSLRDILDELRAMRRLPEVEDFHAWRARLIGLFENTEAADYEEVWHLADGSNIRVLARPHPHGSLAFNFDDVTERLRLEQRYRHSIELRRATLDGLNKGIAVFGANGLLQFVNHAFHEIWGIDSDSVYSAMHARQLIRLCEEITDSPEVWQKLHGFITGEENRRSWTARLRTGAGRVLTARFAPLPDGSTLAVFTDVTEAERTAEAMAEHEVAIGMAEAARVAAGDLVAHRAVPALDRIEAELGALLDSGPIEGAASALTETAAELRQAVHEIGTLAGLPVDPSADGDDGGSPAEALEAVAASLAPRATRASIRLSTESAEAPPRVDCPPGRLRQIAFALALDAIGRVQPGGAVVLGVRGTPEQFQINAECSMAEPSSAAVEETEPLARLRRIAGHDDGTVAVEPDAASGRVRVTCRFGDPRPGRGEADTTGYGNNVQELRPRAG